MNTATTTGISLEKGQAISLEKAAPSVSKFYVALGWQEQSGMDLDVSAFVCKNDANGNPVLFPGSDPLSNLVFFNNVKSPDGAVQHSGDNLSGADNVAARGTPAEKDDESITIDFDRLNPEVDEIAIILTIHQAAERGLSFSKVRDSFIRIAEGDASGREVASFKPTEDYSDKTAVQLGSFMKKGGHWQFEAVGQGFVASLNSIVAQFSA